MRKTTLAMLFSVSLFFWSCASYKTKGHNVIKGNYAITKIEKIDGKDSEIEVVVYDKREHTIRDGSSVVINELKLSETSKNDGIARFRIPAGKYTMTILYTGN